MRKMHSKIPFLILLGCTVLGGCDALSSASAPVSGISTAIDPKRQGDATHSRDSQKIDGEIIWSGTSGGLNIWWTTRDLYVESPSGIQKIWGPLAQKGVEEFVAANSDDGSDEPTPAMNCDYDRYFKVLSVVGSLVSFKDSYLITCERAAHPDIDTRFTTIDLAKSGHLSYSWDVDLANLGKIIKLTDYFAEEDILRALLADRVVQKALVTVNAPAPPRTLEELVTLIKKDDYSLGDYYLPTDFLTRFAFHHIEGNRVAIRLGLPPNSVANHAMHLQLELLLPIPDRLRAQLTLASERQEGFLMKDAEKIAGEQENEFGFRTDNGIERVK
ncbi:MAG: hypothetical protein C4325_13985 [Blastocatellia bacterium]